MEADAIVIVVGICIMIFLVFVYPFLGKRKKIFFETKKLRCPECGSDNVAFVSMDKLECLDCGAIFNMDDAELGEDEEPSVYDEDEEFDSELEEDLSTLGEPDEDWDEDW